MEPTVLPARRPEGIMKHKSAGTERVPFWLRWLLPVILVLTWLALAGVGGPTFGRLEEVSSNDQASFLPASAEATAAQDWQAKFRDSDEVPGVIVIESNEAFTPAQFGEVAGRGGHLRAGVELQMHRREDFFGVGIELRVVEQ